MRKAPTKIRASQALSMLDRAMKEHLLDREFDTQLRQVAVAYFLEVGLEGCIYCGSEVERWDHLVSVASGGGTVLGNMVPACQSCDDSKGREDYRLWLAGNKKKNPARGKPDVFAAVVARVEAYQKHFGFTAPRDFRAALDAAQVAQYDSFLRLVSAFRLQLTQFGLINGPLSEGVGGKRKPRKKGKG